MRRRTYLAASLPIVTTMAGCSDTDDGTGNGNGNGDGNGNGGSTPTETDLSDETPTESETPTDTDEPTPEGPDPIGEISAISANTDWLDKSVSLSGTGQVVTDPFQASFFTTFVYSHDGSSNFQVELIDDSNGETEALLVNKIGDVQGAVGVGLEDGDYIIDVTADGNWSIELGEPFPPQDAYGIPPGLLSGNQPDVYGQIEIDGRVTFSGTHDGESNFQVRAWDQGNTRGLANALVFNEIGEFEGETSEQLAGLFWIEVESDGAYIVEIE